MIRCSRPRGLVDKDEAGSNQWRKARGMMEGTIKGRLDTVSILPPRSELELRVAAREKGTLQRVLHPAPSNARSRLHRTNATAVIGWQLRVRAGRRSGLVYTRGS